MHSKRAWYIINLLGGVLVLGMYAHGLTTHPRAGEILWGDTPEALRGVYSVTMVSAAVGYFLFSYYFLFVLQPCESKTRAVAANPQSMQRLNLWYALILFPSACWMPLTFHMATSPSETCWLLIRAVLLCVGVGSMGLLGELYLRRRTPIGISGWLAWIGLIAFCLQTAFLDAFVWPALVGLDHVIAS